MQTNIEIPKNPFENERIPDVNPHGFEHMESLVGFIAAELEKYGNKAFTKNYQNDKRYLFLKAEKPKVRDNSGSKFIIELDVGYIDFQDQSKQSLIRLNFIYYENTQKTMMISAYEEGVYTSNIEYMLEVLSGDTYFKLAA